MTCQHKETTVGKIYRSSPILASQGRILAGKIVRCKLCGEEREVRNDVGKSKWLWANWEEEKVYSGDTSA